MRISARTLVLYTAILTALAVALVAFRSAAIALLAPSGAAAPFAFVRESEAGSDAMLQRAATGSISRAEAAGLLDQAKTVAARYPLSMNAPFAAGMAHAAMGDRADAVAALQLTSERNPRNRVVRTWLTDRALREGDYRTALRQLSALMRIEPTLSTQISTAMVPFLFAPGMVDAFADVSEQRPDWLPVFIDQARREPRLASQLHRLMLAIARRRPDAVQPRNVGEVASAAAGRGDVARAATLLRAFYPTAFADDGNLLFDPRFIGIEGPAPFVWTVVKDRGQAELGTAEGMQVSGSFPADTRVAAQALAIQPGGYALRARASGDGAASYRWQVKCASGVLVLDALARDVERLSRVDAGLEFVVPTGCTMPELALVASGDGSGNLAVPSAAIHPRR